MAIRGDKMSRSHAIKAGTSRRGHIALWGFLLLLAGWLLGQSSEAAAQSSRPDDEITKLADDVYLFRHRFHQAIFITTPKGVIVTDPISLEAATWLKGEIKRLTDQPVRYVVYSHDHNDHITGGSVFADTAVFVSHAAARPKILEEADAKIPVPDLTFTDRLSIDLGGKRVELIYTGRNHGQQPGRAASSEQTALRGGLYSD